MPAIPVYGQEDDDFAYQDEHIEMESDNQEHDDLEQTEFDSDPALIAAAARLPIARVSFAPKASASATKPAGSPSQAVTARQTVPERAVKPALSAPAKAPAKPRPKKKAAATTKRTPIPAPRVAIRTKRASQSGKKKQTPVQKSRATTREKTPAKTAAAPKKSFSRRKKTIAKPLGKAKVIRGRTGTKRRSA